MRTSSRVALALTIVAAGCLGCRRKETEAKPVTEVRLGYFGNLTHAQAVLGVSSGDFASAVAPATFKTKVFNAGPSLIEALQAGEIDIGYVGPGPALNAHVKTRGEGIRIIAGAAANGVLIVARKDSGVEKLEDLRGKRIATPQHGNTQDIAARYYVMKVLHQSDSNTVLPIQNPEQAKMMLDRQIDAAWAPEPWGSRLIAETGAHIVAEEKDLWPDKEFVLTLVVTTPRFLKNHADVVRKVLGVHHQWTQRLQTDPTKYLPQLEEALFAISGKKLPPGVLKSSVKTVKFIEDPLPATLRTMAQWAYELEFAPQPADLTGLIDTRILNTIQTSDAPAGKP